MQIAFKEWAVICEALGSGRQLVILRKGGIVEESGEFRPEHDAFLLFPTYVHQAATGILDDAKHLLDAALRRQPPQDRLMLRHMAKVETSLQLHDIRELDLFRGEHIWTDAVIAERFHRWHNEMVHALIVRVYNLPLSVELAMKPEYGGCKSWVELEEDILVDGAIPVLDDEEFQERVDAIHAALKR